MLSTLAKLTSNGQVSLPADVRRRWDVDTVMVMDLGDYLVISPWPEDPLEYLIDKFAKRANIPGRVPLEEMRAEARAAAIEKDERYKAEWQASLARRKATEGEVAE